MRVLKTISFKVESDLKALDQVLSHFDQLHQSWIPRKDWLQCQLALAEGFTNTVRHAHKDLPTDMLIEVEITLSEQSLEIRIWDYGSFFDLTEFLKIIAARNNQLTGHGQGIPILHKIAAHLSYSR
ncbi:MAG: ATP-binding protein, partial [Microcystaceae cyanobacterium]